MITVFAGPSLAPHEVRAMLPAAEVLGPAARGSVYEARERGAGLIVLIDGVFSHQLAVSPREIVEVLTDGAAVLGASSMGAIRAAECWPAGMRGIGAVFRMYRLGLLESDDAVAVATDPDNDYAAVSVALVNVFAAMRRARGRGLLSAATASEIEERASGMFFAQRTWRSILHGQPPSVLEFCTTVDVKRADAIRAVRAADGMQVPSDQARPREPFARPTRYSGHDPLVGLELKQAQDILLRWLFGSGRYQHYLWPLVAGEPQLAGAGDPDDLRERLVGVLADLLAKPDELAARLFDELQFQEEFESELMRWYATDQLAAGKTAPRHLLTAARENVAITHGYSDWKSLNADLINGKLFGAIPQEWVEEACRLLAQAKS